MSKVTINGKGELSQIAKAVAKLPLSEEHDFTKELIKAGVPLNDCTRKVGMAIALSNSALNGDTAAAKEMAIWMGERPAEKTQTTVEISERSYEELTKVSPLFKD